MIPSYDAILLVSFGGPEGMDDVIPFLENVLRGKNVPRERLLQVAKHYEMFGGVSPINEQNRQIIAALKEELAKRGPDLPIYFGNRNWHPMLTETLRQMRDDGITNALAFVTSAYSSFSSCRQYLENIAEARTVVGADAPRVEKIRAFYNHPLFIQANVENVCAALAHIPAELHNTTRIAFTAHSIPMSMATNCDYQAQLNEACGLVGKETGMDWRLVFQSRSGSPAQPWLAPDILDYLRELREEGVSDVIISPIGFVSDHMEIIYDLDTEAMALSRELGLNMIRVATPGTHPAFVKMIRELIMERIDPQTPRRSVGTMGPRQDACNANCCLLVR